jgi:hypothetical protein
MDATGLQAYTSGSNRLTGDFRMNRQLTRLMMVGVLGGLGAIASAVASADSPPAQQGSYSDDEVAKAASKFFATGAKELSDVLGKVMKEKGQPVGFIRGEEASGAVGVGLRYGHGELVLKAGGGRRVYWQGPSLGFDLGANASKVFILVYALPSAQDLFQRFPGVEGTLYFVCGFGVTYLQSGKITLAPVRFGAGWRQGLNVGYMNFSPKKRYNPF